MSQTKLFGARGNGPTFEHTPHRSGAEARHIQTVDSDKRSSEGPGPHTDSSCCADSLLQILDDELPRLYNLARLLVTTDTEAEAILHVSSLCALDTLNQSSSHQFLVVGLVRTIIAEIQQLRNVQNQAQSPESDHFPKTTRRPQRSGAKDYRSENPGVESSTLLKELEPRARALAFPDRQVFALRDIAQFSINEVAYILNIDEAQVAQRLNRARLQLRAALTDVFEQAILDLCRKND